MSYVRGHFRKTRSGSTWVKGHSRSSSGSGLIVGLVVICFVIYIVYSIIKAIFTFIITNFVVILIVLSPFVVGFVIYLILRYKQKKYFEKLCLETDEFINSFPENNEEHIFSIVNESKKIRNKQLVRDQLNDTYQELISKIVKTGLISNEVEQFVKNTENAFGLDADSIKHSKTKGFLSIYEQAVEDNYLTDDEETRLFSIYRSLGIDHNEVNDQIKFLQQLSNSRKIMSTNLQSIICNIPLKKSELCFYNAASQLFKRRTEKGKYFLEPGDRGTLYITDMRIVFMGITSIEIKITDIAHCDVENRKYLELSKIGRVTPYYFFRRFRLSCGKSQNMIDFPHERKPGRVLYKSA
jgi:hypothetical protein